MTLYFFLIASFILAGVAQTVWLRSRASRRFAIPLDRGARFRGRRLLGENKTWTGLVVMVPAVGAAFLVMRCVFAVRAPWSIEQASTLWPGGPATYLALGCWAGLGYALGELPNSFIKRQLDIAPGQQPQASMGRWVCFLMDQTDSVLGALLALACWVDLPWRTSLAILATGPVVHWCFNLVLKWLGVKSRAA